MDREMARVWHDFDCDVDFHGNKREKRECCRFHCDVVINWPAKGDVSIAEAEEFVENLQQEIARAKKLM